MLNNSLRRQLSGFMNEQQPERQPALRRSRSADWIYASDIPVLLSDESKGRLLGILEKAGWEHLEDGKWLLLRKTAEEPPEDWYSGPFGPEAACCRSILARHPGKQGNTSAAVQRILIKAGEEGAAAYEEACLHVHREWAENLRKGEDIPAISMKYFGG